MSKKIKSEEVKESVDTNLEEAQKLATFIGEYCAKNGIRDVDAYLMLSALVDNMAVALKASGWEIKG